MTALEPNAFGRFFEAVYGVPPFPWQQRLAETVVRDRWPDVLALPTAAGKTSVIDIAVFALACQAHRDGSKRTAPRRIVFVVDRRIVVDETFRRAMHLSSALGVAAHGVVRDVADRLRTIAGDSGALPLTCVALRGGAYQHEEWTRTPLHPTVVSSTVDQIGSRLLFRGYGVSPNAWPIHAALLGNDSLIVLDEAHCANPFRQTLGAVVRFRSPSWAQEPVATPFQVVTMSATPRDASRASGTVFDLDAADDANIVLSRRRRASKPARLIVSDAKGSPAAALVTTLVREILAASADGTPRAAAVIVNRVATARAVAAALSAAARDGDVVLLTGRMRPIDRDEITAAWRDRLNPAGRERPLQRPAFVVATQCLEVGADFDFDVLVSECASLDALRQRFGRLNRTGRPIDARAAVVIRADQTSPPKTLKDTDPIYGDSLPLTWQWLKARATDDIVDFGIAAMDALIDDSRHAEPEAFERLSVPAPDAPVMLPAYLDRWVQTSPVPTPDPDVAIFLHGIERGEPDVYVCWRKDLSGSGPDAWLELLSICPPVSTESLPVPLSLARRWVGGLTVNETGGDVLGASAPDDGELRTERPLVFRWHGRDSTTTSFVDDPREVAAGDVLVTSAATGCWNQLGDVPALWNTPSRIDRWEEATFLAHGRPVLRVTPEVVAGWPVTAARDRLLSLLADDEYDFSGAGRRDLMRVLRDVAREAHVSEWAWLRNAIATLAASRHAPKVLRHPFGGVVLKGDLVQSDRPSDDLVDEDDRSENPASIELEAHSEHVAYRATQLTDTCLNPALAAAIVTAAHFHDVGKADLRFQAWLRGGSSLAARAAGVLLAKSPGLPMSTAERRMARIRSGYPEGGRHELLSVRLVESSPMLMDRADRDLVRHLIASHHGRCRPFAPVITDPEPRPVSLTFPANGEQLVADSQTELERLDSGVSDRFWQLVQRFGWWGLVYLELLLRVADHDASHIESQQAIAAARQSAS
jgi:CRISPR-associated endonuclease/helicase Cas3